MSPKPQREEVNMTRLEELVGKEINVRELNYQFAVRDGQPEEVIYQGFVEKVDGHMLYVSFCKIIAQRMSRPRNQGGVWFNTMASSFQSLREVSS